MLDDVLDLGREIERQIRVCRMKGTGQLHGVTGAVEEVRIAEGNMLGSGRNLLMDVGMDYQRAAELGIERAELEPVVSKARQYRQALAQLNEARALLDEEPGPRVDCID